MRVARGDVKAPRLGGPLPVAAHTPARVRARIPAWKRPFGVRVKRAGAGNRDRTGDIQLGKLAFYR
jgi:hypothetical protein